MHETTSQPPLFQAKNISYWIPQSGWLFTNISMHIHEGEIVCLFGKNGSGKSSLMKTILNFSHQNNNKNVFFRGQNPSSLKEEDYKKLWGWLPQDVLRPQNNKLNDFLNLPFPYLKDVQPLYPIVEDFEVDHLQSQNIDQLSGGEWKRAQLARLWRTNAPLFFLDEPDSNLDLYQKMRLEQNIKKQVLERKTSFFIATHDISWGLKICHRFYVLSEQQLTWSSQTNGFELDYTQRILSKTYGEKVFTP